VLQANIHNMADLLQAARVADVATTSSDPTFEQLLTEIRVSNKQHAKHNAAFELLSSRLNNFHVSSADTNNTSHSRSSSPRRVRFDTGAPTAVTRLQLPSLGQGQTTTPLLRQHQQKQLQLLRYDTSW